jgi:PAS domain-containing protein
MKESRGSPKVIGHEQLRHNAEELIEKGLAPRFSGGSLGVDALNLLHKHASSAETAVDALKLLHELQTHQVELDLLYEQLQANEHEITEEFIRYKSLFESAPAAYIVVANDGQIIEGNQAAAILFNAPVMALAGKALSDFLAFGQEELIGRLLRIPIDGIQDFRNPKVSWFELPDGRRLRISARHADTGDSTLMMLTEVKTVPDNA